MKVTSNEKVDEQICAGTDSMEKSDEDLRLTTDPLSEYGSELVSV